MVFPVHLQRSAVAAILDCPVRHQFTGPESLKPVALQLIWLFQESLRSKQMHVIVLYMQLAFIAFVAPMLAFREQRV